MTCNSKKTCCVNQEISIKFWPGDKAIIIDPNIECTVNGVRITPLGITYSVHYWTERAVSDVLCYGYELKEVG